MIPNDLFNSNLFDWQIDLLAAFDRKEWRFAILELHRRSRKTTTGLNLCIRECCKHPQHKYGIVFPLYTQARQAVWDDPLMLFRWLPPKEEFGWEKNEQKFMITFANGSLLRIHGADNPDTFRSLDSDGVDFEEWAQMKPEIWAEIFRPIIAQDENRWAIFDYTPKGINHATTMFDAACCLDSGGVLPVSGKAEKMLPGWYAARLDAELSGIISEKELELAKRDMPLSLYEQEFRCARITEEQSVLITSAMLDALPRPPQLFISKRLISVDPATGGDDCSVKVFHNYKVIDSKSMHYQDTTKIIGDLMLISVLHQIDDFIVDSIGIGKGIADGLRKLKKKVMYFNSSESAVDDEMFCNKRAEAWFGAAKLVRNCKVDYVADLETRRQIPYASRYKVNSRGQIQIIDKQKIKSELGRSPDDADAWVMGIYGIDRIPETADMTAVGVGNSSPYDNNVLGRGFGRRN